MASANRQRHDASGASAQSKRNDKGAAGADGLPRETRSSQIRPSAERGNALSMRLAAGGDSLINASLCRHHWRIFRNEPWCPATSGPNLSPDNYENIALTYSSGFRSLPLALYYVTSSLPCRLPTTPLRFCYIKWGYLRNKVHQTFRRSNRLLALCSIFQFHIYCSNSNKYCIAPVDR